MICSNPLNPIILSDFRYHRLLMEHIDDASQIHCKSCWKHDVTFIRLFTFILITLFWILLYIIIAPLRSWLLLVILRVLLYLLVDARTNKKLSIVHYFNEILNPPVKHLTSFKIFSLLNWNSKYQKADQNYRVFWKKKSVWSAEFCCVFFILY